MKIENQLTSLVPSKQLKDLGIKQDSLWVWVDTPRGYKIILNRGDSDIFRESKEQISAFTVAEFGEILPCHIRTKKSMKGCCDNGNIAKGFSCFDEHAKEKKYFHADTEADARGKMLIYLIENKLLK